MASCTTATWGNSNSPRVTLTVTQSSSTATSATLSWKLQYIAPYAVSGGSNRSYTVTVDGTKKTGTYSMNGVTGTKTMATGTKTVTKGTSSKSVSFSVSFGVKISWNGTYKETISASGSISVGAKTSYTVSYNANGGSGAPGSQTKWHGTTLTLSSTKPTRSGYTFMGWGTSTTDTSVDYSAGGSYTANASDTLYAIWRKTLTLSYNANGGSGAPSSQSANIYNATTSYKFTLSSTKPTKTGHSFLGWSTSSSATSASYSAGGTITLSANDTLYAVWKANTYTISYNANGGSGAPGSQTKTYGVTLTLSSTVPTRTNYNFKGWATTSSATSASYSAGANYTSNAAATLYAVWELAYTKPRITGAKVFRCDSEGNTDDFGESMRIKFNWATDQPVTKILVEWAVKGSTTWTSDEILDGGTTSGSYDNRVDGISIEDSYEIKVTVQDSLGETLKTYSLLGAKFPIDFLAGGAGVAIGKPAQSDDTFEVALGSRFRKDIVVGPSNSWTDGLGGTKLSINGGVRIQRGDANASPYVDFMLPGSSEYDSQIKLSYVDKALNFLGATKYYFDNMIWCSKYITTGSRQAYRDGKPGALISHDGYMELQRSDPNYMPYIAFFLTNTAADTTPDGQVRISSVKNMEFAYSDGYSFDDDVYVGPAKSWDDTAGGTKLSSNGGLRIQRTDTSSPYIDFWYKDSTSWDGRIYLYPGSNNMWFEGASNYWFDSDIRTNGPIYGGWIASNGNIRLQNNDTTGSVAGTVNCYWKDGSVHDLISRSDDGLTSGLGWAGSSSYATVTVVRGRTCKYMNASGTTTLSDERMKKDFTGLDKWDSFYDKLEPLAFKMKGGSSGRFHLGFKAQQVEQALIDSGLTTSDFAGFIKMEYKPDPDDPEGSAIYEEAGIKPGDDEYGLIYTEFVAMNTYKIQKLQKENDELKSRVSDLEARLQKLEALLTSD